MRFVFIILLVIRIFAAGAQTLGGGAVYQFLKLPASPLLAALGGVNVSYIANDVSLAINNPALLSDNVHAHLGLSFNSYFAGIKAYHLAGAHHAAKWNTTIGGSVLFVDYGSAPQADATGNEEGRFRPRDYVLQISAAQRYLERWQYGLTFKLIRSEYGVYRSTGIAADAGVLYKDTANRLSLSLLAKNMGVQLSAYNIEKEDLPFDLQIGVTKNLEKAPFGFSLTAQQLHRHNIYYNDTAFNSDNGFSSGSSFFDKLFNHLVVGAHLFVGNHLDVTIGYNRLRRTELSLGSSGNGVNGFSAGFNAKFRSFHLQYSRAYFQRSSAYNQFGLTLKLPEIEAIGRL